MRKRLFFLLCFLSLFFFFVSSTKLTDSSTSSAHQISQEEAPAPTPPSAHHDENRQIFQAGAPAPTSSTHDKDIEANGPTTSPNSKRRSIALIIFVASGITVLTFLLLLISYLLCRRKRRQGDQRIDNYNLRDFAVNFNFQEEKEQQLRYRKFSLSTLKKATRNFNSENKLGAGGFGPVYKGTLASTGEEIAVKKLSSTSGQGIREFMNEVKLITGLQHKNLVKLLGYCSKRNEMLLVYEYMPNKSLDVLIFSNSTNNLVAPLDWETRKSITKGSARGLVYLHEDSRLKIIHRDFKTSNVLLDHEMNPKISDFGMARLVKDDQSEANTDRPAGTHGYMPPEYCMRGVISHKLDVFSFGVVLLEIISGRKNYNFNHRGHNSLLSYTWELWRKGKSLKLMDEAVAQSCNDTEEVSRFIHIGLLCVQENSEDRPSMSYVLRMLESTENIAFRDPKKPPFYGDQPNLEASQQSALDAQVGSVTSVTSLSFSGV